MNPRLMGIDGPLADRTFVLDGECSLGRDTSNSVEIPDASVSRRHCVLKPEAPCGRFRLLDCDSHNGTYVNGLPVDERLLEHGDQIKVGRSHFVFLTMDAEVEASAIRIRHLTAREDTVVLLRREDSVYLRPEAALAASPARSPRALRALFDLVSALHSAQGVRTLARRILALVLEHTPADRAALVLIRPHSAEPELVYGYDRGEGLVETISLSREFLDRGWREEVALFSNRAVTDSGDSSCVMVAPLVSTGRPLGVLYLESADPKVAFSEEDLQLLTAIGLIAGPAVEDAAEFERLHEENARLAAAVDFQHEMIGQSAAMRSIYRTLAKVAPADCTVLLRGETGTGKELTARAIHRNSPRAGKPLVAINCATLSETLLESDLFGHERGAFTGAVSQKRGKFEVADGGTIFLDEVGELPLSLQAKLLRVLQERQFERVGGTRSISVDVRLIAATNRDLRSAVEAGTFRSDLFYRLNVVCLTLPPLRERPEDIPELAESFVQMCAQRLHRPPRGVDPQALACLTRYSWPGNVRELQNAIEHAVVLSSGPVILPEDLPECVLESAADACLPQDGYHTAVQREKRRLILEAVRQAEGNITEAARILGLNSNYLHRLIRDLDLRQVLNSIR